MNSSDREIAKHHRQNGDYEKSIQLYETLWVNRGSDWDRWLGWEYADSLKKLGKIDTAINVCKVTFSKWKDFKYNNNLLCWLLFEKFIKPVTQDAKSTEINKMVRIAGFITKHVKQEGKKTAYESSVFRVIDILKAQNNVNEHEILKWVNMLDYLLLSNQTIIFNLEDGKQKEGASRLEDYFSLKTKALEKLEKYKECIECCKIAKQQVDKFHYDNDIWISARHLYSQCMISDGEIFNTAIQELEALAEKKQHWSIYTKAFNCYFFKGRFDSAIVCGSKALITKDPFDKKASLLFTYGLALEAEGDIPYAIKHFLFSNSIRKDQGWGEKKDIKEKLIQYRLDPSTEVDIRDLKEYWLKRIYNSEQTFNGVIKTIMPHGKSGFIATSDGKTYFFKKSSVIFSYNQIEINKSVSFTLIDSFDSKKQIKTKEAVNIILK